jgi:hypothetical protein
MATLHSLTVRMLVIMAILAACVGSRAADLAPEPPELGRVQLVAYEGDILLEPTTTVAEPIPAPSSTPSVVPPRSVIQGGTGMPSGSIVESVSGPLDGMFIDEGFDEMPFEASSGRWFWNGGWYAGGESLWMGRSINNRQKVVFDSAFGFDPQTGDPRVSYTTYPQPFNVAPGARATIGKSLGRDYLDRDRSIEFVYYGGMTYSDVAGWNGVNGDNSLFTPLNVLAPGFNAAGTYLSSFNSDFNSYEWNYKLRRRLGRDKVVMSPDGRWSKHAERGWLPAIIIGPRLVNSNEDYLLESSRPGVSTDQFGGRYLIHTSNWLLGLNLGGELVSQNEFYYWGLRGRAAPSLTFADATQYAVGVNTTGTGPGGTISLSDAETRTAPGFVGDLTLFAGWNITPNFAFQVGYDFLWVAGMATATRQFNLDNRDNYAIDTGGQTFYNGLSFGFNGSW